MAPGTPVLEGKEGSKVLANWATDIGGAVGGGVGNKAVEVEDILGAIAGSGGGGGTVASTLGSWQRQSPKPPPLPLPALWASVARDAMVRLSLSLSPSLSVGVSKLILTT